MPWPAILTCGQKRYAHTQRDTFCELNREGFPQYAINFYLGYFSRWPDMCAIQETPQGRIMGYGRSPSMFISHPTS